MRVPLVAGAVLALAGCGGAPKPAPAAPPPVAQKSAPPPGPACADVAPSFRRVRGELAAKVALASCPADGWSAEQIRCFVAVTDEAEFGRCGDALTQQQRDTFDARLGLESPSGAGAPHLMARSRTGDDDSVGGDGDASGGGAPGDAIDPDHPDTGVPECDEYVRMLVRFLQCDKIPQEARDAAKPGFEQVLRGWGMLKDPNTPAAARKAAGDVCKQSVVTMTEDAKKMGCTL